MADKYIDVEMITPHSIEVDIQGIQIDTHTPYAGPYTVPAPIGTDTVLAVSDKYMAQNLTITAIEDKGDPSGDISAVAQVVNIPVGYYGTAGTVKIAATEQAKVVASSILYGKDILGVNGTADHILEVTSIPSTKMTSIIHNTTDNKYYLWKE